MKEFLILNKQIIARDIKRIDVRAPLVAAKAKPGQYVLVMPDEKTMRTALMITEVNAQKQSITLVFKETNSSLERLGNLWINDSLYTVIGPLGAEEHFPAKETIACVGYGLGIASVVPVCRALRKTDNKVIGIIGEKTNKKIIFESQMRLACHKFFLMVEDGSSGRKGHVTDGLQQALREEKISLVYVAGPLALVKAVCEITKKKNIKTKIILPLLTTDGIGIGGCSSLWVKDQSVCVATEGPIVQSEDIDFDALELKIKNFAPEIKP